MGLALYRKYRPQTFAEVIGQEHVTEPLISAINNGRLNHAYLFSGPRGCGKTSSARILARSLNCAQGPTATPCGTCDSCIALATGGQGSIDVIEIDAASHGGVEDARDLREKAIFAPVNSRFKVYVIDEAHMVSSAGFNALLKLVEEPPDYVMFVFATTEPDKVLPTIRSRTHHYPFRLVPPAAMRQLCERLCQAEGIQVEPEVYPLVIRAGGGSARDTLSVLDQLIAGSGDNGVTYRHAVSLLGVTDSGLLDQMCDALAAMDGSAALACIDQVAAAGHDPRRFAADLLERLRDLIVLNQIPDAAEQGVIDVPPEVLQRMTGQALRMGTATLSRIAELMHEALGAMRGTTAPRLLLELACAKAVLPTVEDSSAALLQRLEVMEKRIDSGSIAAVSSVVSTAPEVPASTPAPVVAAAVMPEPAPPAPAVVESARSSSQVSPPVAGPPGLASPPPASPTQSPMANAPAEAPQHSSPPVPSPITASSGETAPISLSTVLGRWEDIKQATKSRKPRVGAFVMEAEVTEVDGTTMVLTFKHSFHAEALKRDDSMQVFQGALTQILGGNWRVECVVADAASKTSRVRPPSPPVKAPSVVPVASEPIRPPESGSRPVATPKPAPEPPKARVSTADDPSWPSEPVEDVSYTDDDLPASSSMARGSFRPLAGGLAGEDEAVALFTQVLGAKKI